MGVKIPSGRPPERDCGVSLDAMDIGQIRYRPWLLLASAVVPLAVAALLSLVRDQVSTASRSVPRPRLVVVAASSSGVRLVGLTAALSSGVFFDLFLIQPYGTLAVINPDDVEALVLLLAVGVAVTELALWGRRQQASSSRRLGYLDGVLSAAEKVAARDPNSGDLVAVVADELIGLLGLDGAGSPRSRRTCAPLSNRTDESAAGSGNWTWNGTDCPRMRRSCCPSAAAVAPSAGSSSPTATRVRRPSTEQLRVAVLLVDQVGFVVARAAGDGRGSVKR
jgi:hypothetical protein